MYHERFRFPIYADFEQTHIYRSRYADFDARLQHTFGFSQAIGIGASLEYFKIKPKMRADVAAEASNSYLTNYIYYQLNTLNKRNFSTRGWNVKGQLGWVYAQEPRSIAFETDSLTQSDTTNLHGYAQFRFKAENFKPLSPRITLLTQFNTAINFSPREAYLNFFNIGGINDFIRNPERFWRYVQTEFPGNIVRSKGIFWLASRPDDALVWSQAGGSSQAELYGKWWASVPEAERVRNPAYIQDEKSIRKKWDEEWSDRMNELVFIGTQMNARQVRDELYTCILTDEEVYSFHAGRKFNDPWPL